MYSISSECLRQLGSEGQVQNEGLIVGWLIALRRGDQLHVCSCIRLVQATEAVETDRLLQDIGEVQHLLPAGLAVAGVLLTSVSGLSNPAALRKLLSSLRILQQESSQILVAAAGAPVTFHEVDSQAQLCPVDVKMTVQHPAADAVLLRLALSVQLQIYTRQNVAFDHAVSQAFAAIANELCSDSALLIASLPEQGQALLDAPGSQQTCGDLWAAGGGTPVPVSCYVRRAPHLNDSGQCIAPSLEWQPIKDGPMLRQTATLELDVLAYAPADMLLSTCAAHVIKPGIRRQLESMQASVCSRGKVVPHCACLFRPSGLGHCISVVLPFPRADAEASQDSSDMMQQRLALHKRLNLPPDRPALRMANVATFAGDDSSTASTSGRLRDVHIGIADSGIPGGRVHTIWGSYDYHHYMQDKFDDRGWGCAYRSLQTIWSWMRVQHYTSAPIPTHRQIQQTLADIGDKPRSFVGSKQWIGAIELGYVLDTCLSLTCKVLTVSSGADIEGKARELAQHFDEQGMPVMIGGGVLAYTLLGVHFDPSTGECAFLILDPHYTGQDALPKVHNGQWIAWKRLGGNAAAGGQLFRADAYYNLLCPQRPLLV